MKNQKTTHSMKLEQQYCTLNQAKTLKSLGITQGVDWFWVYPMKESMISTYKGIKGEYYAREIINENEGDEFDHDMVAAYSVAEISQMLPDYYPSWRFKRGEQSEELIWVATVICGPKPEGIDNIRTASAFDRYGKTQAEALATLLIALLETETITAEDCNKRLLEA